jgi:hypothetical protein
MNGMRVPRNQRRVIVALQVMLVWAGLATPMLTAELVPPRPSPTSPRGAL